MIGSIFLLGLPSAETETGRCHLRESFGALTNVPFTVEVRLLLHSAHRIREGKLLKRIVSRL